MAITLALRTDARNQIISSLDGSLLATTPLDQVPSLELAQADPYNLGKKLMDALGGAALLQRLNAEGQGQAQPLLLLDCDPRADTIPWEFSALPDHQLFVVQYGLLRLVDAPTFAISVGQPQESPLQFIALAADPLVDEKGNPLDTFLKLNDEMSAIRRALADCGKLLAAQRVPPTRDALQRALRQGPAILHLSCHGNVVNVNGDLMAALFLEDADGRMDILLGRDLVTMPPRGAQSVRMVLLSACRTDQAIDSRIARALVRSGVPFAIGMQGKFPDDLADDIAVALYESALSGLSLAESLRQARIAIAKEYRAVGLPVGYTARNGWLPLSLSEGQANVGALGLPGNAQLTSEVQPPRPLYGRNRELHELAQLYSRGHKVVTVTGTGGMGKTALAASFVERFAWRWREGVRTISFASDVVDADAFRRTLLRVLRGEVIAQQLADADVETQTQIILQTLRDWNGLLLLDNYESVLQGISESEQDAESKRNAESIHQLVAQMANGGAMLLLTSRDNPAHLSGEIVFPKSDRPLTGLELNAGAALFFRHSTKTKDHVKEFTPLALNIANVTEGHPRAIALLAGEFDASDIAPAEFLKDWENELANAKRKGLSPHHWTFATAFERSYARLTADEQKRLRALSVIAFPFFAQGAAFVWQIGDDEKNLGTAREYLSAFSHRNLLEVDGYFADKTSATYRFQPALRQEAARRVQNVERAVFAVGYAAYAYWFVNYARDEIGRQPAIARLAQQAANELIAQADAQPADRLARYCWQLGTILQQFGRIGDAEKILERGAASAEKEKDNVPRERILFQLARLSELRGDLDRALSQYEQAAQMAKTEKNEGEYSVTQSAMANIFVTRGDLDGAMQLYHQSLAIKEQLGDLQGKSATLHQMAGVFVTRGDLGGAMQLYQQSAAIDEQLGDLKGKSATLHQMANVFVTRGDLAGAMQLYHQSLAIQEQLGNLQGKAATLHNIAQVFVTRGDLDNAIKLYQQSLQIKEQLGDLQGKATTLHAMANVYATRADLDRALELFRESLAIKEQLGDVQGKATTLHQVAGIWFKRGNLDQALLLYQESLELFRQLADLQGIMASLTNLAAVRSAEGKFDRAFTLYQESLQLSEQIRDGRSKVNLLNRMADVCWKQGDIGRAIELLQLATHEYKQLSGNFHGRASAYLKLGDLYQSAYSYDLALTHYREAYYQFLNAFELEQSEREKREAQRGAANAMELLGRLEARLGATQALSDLTQAEKLYAESGDSRTATAIREERNKYSIEEPTQ